jgi:hypothetical protein
MTAAQREVLDSHFETSSQTLDARGINSATCSTTVSRNLRKP